jgi:beta-glucosidase
VDIKRGKNMANEEKPEYDGLTMSSQEIVALMSDEEKVNLLTGKGGWWTGALPRFGLKSIEMHDGPTGLRVITGIDLARAETATCYPSACLTACSWDPAMMEKVGASFAEDAKAHHTDMVLAPAINIKRHPLGGRNFEYYSEDPLLTGKLAAGYIKGIQARGVGTSLKHFACNNSEYCRNLYSSEVDERALREIYLKGFEIAVKEANPWTIMCSYNRINGVYSAQNSWLLKTVLHDEWGYKGVVISDWGATVDVITDHNNGLDIEMPCPSNRNPDLLKALQEGQLKREELDADCVRLVTLLKRKNAPVTVKPLDKQETGHALAKKVAEESIVLLKNEEETLPIKNLDDVAIIGAYAKSPRYQGNGSSHVDSDSVFSFIKAVNNPKIPYAKGFTLKGDKEDEATLLKEATEVASKAKKVLLFLGVPSEEESEGYDKPSFALPANQIKLYDEISKVCSSIIVILSCGSAIDLSFASSSKGILLTYLAGEAIGEATFDILTGKVSPSGKLAESWPLSLNDVASNSCFQDRTIINYKDSIYVGYRYYLSAHKSVAYPFGYGLSYAHFSYRNLLLSKKTLAKGEEVEISFTLKNESKIPATEIVELYSGEEKSTTFKPLRELRGFTRVDLKGGESKKVTMSLAFSSLAHYDTLSHSFQVEAGHYCIEIGRNCLDIALKGEIEVHSSFVAYDLHSSLPNYYYVSNVGNVSNEEFSSLLQRPLRQEPNREKRPYNLNSTLYDCRKSWLVKVTVKKLKKSPLLSSFGSNISEKDIDDQLYNSPIRFLGVMGLPIVLLEGYVDILNLHYFRGVHRLIKGVRILKNK